MYQDKYKETKNAKETVAWSDGKEASGRWSIMVFPSTKQCSSGLSKWKNLWKIKFAEIATTTE